MILDRFQYSGAGMRAENRCILFLIPLGVDLIFATAGAERANQIQNSASSLYSLAVPWF
jgi:hypothetical protein